jgi:hypothetical protein
VVEGLRAVREFVLNGMLAQLMQSVFTLREPWTLAAVAIVAGVVYLGRRKSLPAPTGAVAGVAFGAVGVALAVLPYAAVGKYPSVHGWDTRHDLLVGLPMAVLLVSLVRLVAPTGVAATIGAGVLVAVAVCFASATIEDYALIQARWAGDRAVMAELAANSGSAPYSVYWVGDSAPGPQDYYRFYEWSAMFERVYGDQSRIGLDTREYSPSFLANTRFFTDRYDLADLDPLGCEATLRVEPTSSGSHPAQVALRYTWLRLFQPSQLAPYLDSLVTVDVTRMPTDAAAHCAQ